MTSLARQYSLLSRIVKRAYGKDMVKIVKRTLVAMLG